MRLSTSITLVLLLLSGASAFAESERYAIRWVENVNRVATVPIYAAQRSAPFLFDADTVMAGSREGRVLAFDKSRGNLKWQALVESAIEADLAKDSLNVYAGTISGGVYALVPETGDLRWKFYVGQEILGQPASNGERVFFSAANNQVYALHVTDGSWAWQYSGGDDPSLSIRGIAGVTLRGDDLFTGFSNGTVVRLDATTGQVRWSQQWKEVARFQDIDATPVIEGGRLYTVLFGKRLLALDPKTGGTLWTASVQAHRAPEIDGGKVYLGGLDGKLYVYDAADGMELRVVSVSDSPLNKPTVVEDRIYLTDGKGRFRVLDRESLKTLWTYKGSVSGFHTPAVVSQNHQVYLLTNMGNLYRISPFWNR